MRRPLVDYIYIDLYVTVIVTVSVWIRQDKSPQLDYGGFAKWSTETLMSSVSVAAAAGMSSGYDDDDESSKIFVRELIIRIHFDRWNRCECCVMRKFSDK